ncbi:MAG: TonB-dependent receptor, partial [Sphingomonadales bacterium]|nr:TonB-dependent receptor [Sphingomonadales bacterium]
SPRALGGIGLHGAYSYNEAMYHDFIGQCYGGQTPADGCNQQPRVVGANTVYNGQVYSNRIAPKAPKHSWQLGANYEADLGGLTAGMTVDVNHTSSYNYTDTLIPEAVQPGFTRLDGSITLGRSDDGWKIALIGRNLTNQFVVTSANEFPFTGGSGTGTAAGIKSDLNTVVERPREISVELTYRF